MPTHQVALTVNENGYGSITIDGKKIYARAVHICVHAGERTQITLDLIAGDVMVTADGETYALASMCDEAEERLVFPILLPAAPGKH